jgi:hypothetical protein
MATSQLSDIYRFQAVTANLGTAGQPTAEQFDAVKDAVPLARALLDGGIDVMELTLRTPAALDALLAIRAEVPDMLAGTGTVVIEGSTYPAVPGALYRIDAGKVHAAYPDEGVVLAALVCYEPPLEDPETDRVLVTAEPDSTTRAGR